MRHLCLYILLAGIASSDFAWGEAKFDSLEQTVAAGLNDTTAQLQFKFTNNGDKPLVIGKITTSCGCTTAAADRQIYLPNEKGTLSVSVNIETAEGQLNKEVAIEINDGGSTSLIKLYAHIQIPQVITFEPDPYLRWDQGESPTSKATKISVVATFPLKLVGVKSWHEKIKASLQEVIPGKEYIVTVMPVDTKDVVNTALELLPDATWPGGQKKLWLLVHIKPKGEI